VLAILNGADVVYVATRSGTRPLGLSFNIGMRLPAYLAASGKAMLAHLGEGPLRALLAGRLLAPMAQRDGPTFDALLGELADVRANGYSVDDEGVREGVYCIGAPVFDGRGVIVAGIGMCLQKSHRQLAARDVQRRHVIDVAARLTQRLGGKPQ
jgi:DNA-binding IclR family transcriptional regulator